jgi:hypothetical protein
MKTDKRAEYVARDSIMNLLSETELARVSAVESGAELAVGDEYLDLGELERGVRRAPVDATPVGRVLTRAVVQDETWKKILAVLAAA